MVIRNKIFEEIKTAHSRVLCLLWYTDQRRKWNRWYEFFIAIFASGGFFGYMLSNYAPLIATGVIAFVSTLKALFPQFMQSEKELCDLDGLAVFYDSYENKLDRLFYQLDHDELTENEAAEKIFTLREQSSEKQALMNKLIRDIPKKKDAEWVDTSDDYIRKVYYGDYRKTSEDNEHE
jgi:hypothetical protein